MRARVILLTTIPVFLGALLMNLSAAPEKQKEPSEEARVVLVIHGGAGVRPRKAMTADLEKQYVADLVSALRAGHAALYPPGREPRTSLDAVEAAVRVLEDAPLFNAGKGAVLTHDGKHELDASIMEGKDKRAGAVAGVSTIKNPISAARAVMERSPHVLLTGRGAEAFAAQRKLEIVKPSYFTTPERERELEKAIEEERKKEPQGRKSMGTVGAVAVDSRGNLAAATSTGGMTNKRYGRVGDSPIIGAGTYADNSACAVSCTGHGEIFIRFTVAHDVAARVKYKGETIREAARAVLKGMPKEEGGVGGLIVLDTKGNWAMEFDTEGMYRGTITRDGKVRVWIYKDEAGR